MDDGARTDPGADDADYPDTLTAEQLDLLRQIERKLMNHAAALADAHRTGNADDLFQIARIEAVKRARTYDATRGAAFFSWVYPAAHEAMIKACVHDVRERIIANDLSRSFAKAEGGIVLGDFLQEDAEQRRARLDDAARVAITGAAIGLLSSPQTPEETYLRAERRALLQRAYAKAFATMDPEDVNLVKAIGMQGRQYKEVAEEMAVDYDKLRYRYAKALSVLHQALRLEGVEG